MKKKINVALLFGGKSFEHQVSLLSAKSVLHALDRDKYTVSLMGIDHHGKWHFYEEGSHFIHADDPSAIELAQKRGTVVPFELETIDVIFPILHGPNGEDGTVQGLLQLIDIPYVGADVLGSSIGMDKDVMKRLLREANIPTPHFVTIYQHERPLWPLERVLEKISFPFFVKPANSGSSIGISKVKQQGEFLSAIEEAFRYDRKILIEEAIVGSEVQCSLLGNESPIVSLPCQIIPKGDFHSYASKYLDSSGAEFHIPARIAPDLVGEIQNLALKTYRTLCCEGFARIDLFLSNEGKLFVNEINTLPGLTDKSPYAKMWAASGIGYSELLDRLISLAFERHARDQKRVFQIDAQEKELKHHV